MYFKCLQHLFFTPPPPPPTIITNYFNPLLGFISTKTYVEGNMKNFLNETVLMSTQNICLKSLPKHMLWILKRTVSSRRSFEHPKQKLKLMDNLTTVYHSTEAFCRNKQMKITEDHCGNKLSFPSIDCVILERIYMRKVHVIVAVWSETDTLHTCELYKLCTVYTSGHNYFVEPVHAMF